MASLELATALTRTIASSACLVVKRKGAQHGTPVAGLQKHDVPTGKQQFRSEEESSLIPSKARRSRNEGSRAALPRLALLGPPRPLLAANAGLAIAPGVAAAPV